MAASLGSTTPSHAAYYYDNTTTSEALTTLAMTHSPDVYAFNSVTQFLKNYFIWIIFAFGFPGNMFCVFVVIRMSRRHISTSLLYVAFLAIIDTIAILLKLPLNKTFYKTIVFNEFGCQILYTIGMSISSYASWVLVVMAAERFTAVRFPMKVSLIWTVRKAIIIMLVVFIVIVLIHVHMFVTITHHEYYMCKFKKEYDYIRHVWYYISLAVYAMFPATFLVVFNVLIIWLLKRSGVQRRNMFSEGDAAVVEAQRQERQITIMLVTVTVVFVVLTIPSCIYVLLYDHWNPQDNLGKARKSLIGVLTSCLAHTNHAINFYLYFLSGKRFREKSVSILKCKKKHNADASGADTASSKILTTDTGL